MNFLVYKNDSQGDFLQFYKGLDEGHVSIQSVDGTVLAESDSHFFEYELDNNVSSVVVFADDVYQYRRSKTSDREAHQLDVVISVIDAYLAEVKKKIDEYAKNSFEDLSIDDLEKVLFPVYDRNSAKFELAKLNVQKILGDAVDSQAGSYAEAVEQIINVVDKLSKIVLDFSSVQFKECQYIVASSLFDSDDKSTLKNTTYAQWLHATDLPVVPVGGSVLCNAPGQDANSFMHGFAFKVPVDGIYFISSVTDCSLSFLSSRVANMVSASLDTLKSYMSSHSGDDDVYGTLFDELDDNSFRSRAVYRHFSAGDVVVASFVKKCKDDGSGQAIDANVSSYIVRCERFV